MSKPFIDTADPNGPAKRRMSRFKPTDEQHEKIKAHERAIGQAIESGRFAGVLSESDALFYGHNECDLTVARFLEQLHMDWTKPINENECKDFEPPQRYIDHLSDVLLAVKAKTSNTQ